MWTCHSWVLSSTSVADYNEEDMVLRAQMKAAALEQDSDDEDGDWAPGGFHPAALPRQVVLLNCPKSFGVHCHLRSLF